jgi:nucleoid-associated protein YgaU
VQKATLRMITAPPPNDEPVEVMFNPTEYQITRNMSYAEVAVPGLAMPLLQFVRGEAQQLQLELFLDSSDRKQGGGAIAAAAAAVSSLTGGGAGSAESPTAGPSAVPPDAFAQLARSPHAEHRLMALRRLAEIDSHLHAPHVIEFAWSGARFRGVITSFTERFTMFDENGRIVRARVQLQLKSWNNPDQMFQETNPQSPDRTKTRVVRAGERLDLIASEEYGDAALWTVIARANEITRPRILTPGTLLIVPPLD